jgi:hypothetical protein
MNENDPTKGAVVGIVRGAPDDHELAALMAALYAVKGEEPVVSPRARRRPRWTNDDFRPPIAWSRPAW